MSKPSLLFIHEVGMRHIICKVHGGQRVMDELTHARYFFDKGIICEAWRVSRKSEECIFIEEGTSG